MGGQSNKERKKSSNESRAPSRRKRESKARDGDVAAPEVDTASGPGAYRTRAPKRTINKRRASYGVALGSKTRSAAEGHGTVFAPIAFETGSADQVFDI